jgi:acyl-CoA reductase-like NAD-dependent aldehyde dehydrogenase
MFVSYEDVVRRLVERIDALVGNEKVGPGTLGAIQNPATLQRVDDTVATGCKVIRSSAAVAQPGFEHARSVSPLVVEMPSDRPELFQKELFGPIVCVIPTTDTYESIALAGQAARAIGAITFAAWCTDAALRSQIEDALLSAGANVSFNLTGPIWVNQSATFSDFHVSSGNPAGNASLTDPAFVVRRFFVAASRIPVV